MPFFLSIERFPEVQALPSDDRTELLRRCKVPGAFRIGFFAMARGALLGVGVGAMTHGVLVTNSLKNIAPTVSFMVGVVTFFTSAVLFHIWTMTRFRGQIRIAIHDASKGGRTPICLSCGYDASGVRSHRCPECGMSLLIDTSD